MVTVGTWRCAATGRSTTGPANLVAPHPVRQRDFDKALGAQLHRPAVIPAPRFAVNVRLGKELAAAVGYASQRVEPSVLTEAGFETVRLYPQTFGACVVYLALARE